MIEGAPLHKTGMGSHQSSDAVSIEWLTPKYIIEALGGWESFDLDPCAPVEQPWPTAKKTYTILDNGLIKPWDIVEGRKARVYCNPPYSASEIPRWIGRLADHGCGTALIFARTETAAFFKCVWERATACLFIEGRLFFHYGIPWRHPKTGEVFKVGDKARANAGAPSVLCAFGERDAEILRTCGIPGAYVRDWKRIV